MRAKGALISEPRFSTPCEMRFFPREKGENGLFRDKPSTKAIFPFSRGKNRISQGVENRGSLISAALDLRGEESLLFFQGGGVPCFSAKGSRKGKIRAVWVDVIAVGASQISFAFFATPLQSSHWQLQPACASQGKQSVPPPSKTITGSFFVCGINFVGITRKIGNMVTGIPEIISGELIHGIPGKSGRFSAWCEVM